MKTLIFALFFALSLSACQKEEREEQAQKAAEINKNTPMPSRNPRDFFDNKPSKY